MDAMIVETLKRARDGELLGMYVMAEAETAYPNGTRVRKVAGEVGDTHPVGALATVIGSIGPALIEGKPRLGYFVVWDDMPKVAVFVADYKVTSVVATEQAAT